MTNTPRPPIERRDLATGDAEEVAEYLRRVYVDHHPRVRRAVNGARHDSRLMDGGALRATATNTTLSFSTDTEPFTDAVVRVVHSGRLRSTACGEELSLGPGAVVCYRPAHAYRIEWERMKSTGLTVPMKTIETRARARADLDAGLLRFEGGTPVSPALGAFWARVSAFVVREMFSPDTVLAEPLVADQVLQFVADAMLSVFPNTAMSAHGRRGPGGVAPAAVRRAVSYLTQNADRPVTLDQIADAAGTRPRAIQYAFRRYYDTTPLGYLRRLRLERAHCDLQAGDPSRGDTVARVAHRWGYTSTNSFATAYRNVYGVPPSLTLRT